jgi:hypothetical protein
MILKDFQTCLIFRQGNNIPYARRVWRLVSAFIHKVIHNFWGQAQKTLADERVSALFKKTPQQPTLTGASSKSL